MSFSLLDLTKPNIFVFSVDQVSDWMAETMNYEFLPADMAVRLDLIAQVRGLQVALNFFNAIPPHQRDFKVYGALLASYARDRNIEQAETLMKKMRESGFRMIALYYNVMLKLYSQTKQHEKMDTLMEEMIERGMNWDCYTYNIRLSAYAEASDMEGMEKLLMEMEIDPITSVQWNSYVSVANGYSKCGLTEKASSMLKKAEWLIQQNKEKHGYKILITLCAGIGNKDEVYRLWNLYKRMGHISSTCYFTMITSLLRLDDIEGAEKILTEWDYGKTYHDIRLPRVMVEAYCDKGMLKKAESYLQKILAMGKKPHSSLWDRLAYGYCLKKYTSKALETLKNAIAAGSVGWRPNCVALGSCIDYLKQKGGMDEAKQLLVSLQGNRYISAKAYDALVRYINDKDAETKAIDILKDAPQFRKRRNKNPQYEFTVGDVF